MPSCRGIDSLIDFEYDDPLIESAVLICGYLIRILLDSVERESE